MTAYETELERPMTAYETTLEFAGEERPAKVVWDSVWGELYLDRIEVALDLEGEPRWLDVTPILSARQALALVRKIREALARQRAEDYDDARMQDREERSRYAHAA